MQSNTTAVVVMLLNSIHVKKNVRSIASYLDDHPDYPALLSITDCLTEWNVDNQVYYISKEDYDPKALLFPFIAHFGESGGHFVLIHNLDKGEIIFSDEHEKNSKITEVQFLERWDGVALYAESNSDSREINYLSNRVKYLLQDLLLPMSVLAGVFILFLVLSSSVAFEWYYASLLLVKLSGLIIGVMLLAQGINSGNPFIRNLCGFIGKNDCNTVLKSDAARITSWLSWSEVGFFYFAGSLLALIFVPDMISVLVWLNILVLPYPIYSISYQYLNKSWCVLCCIVQALLLLEFFTAFLSDLITFHFSFRALDTVNIILCFSIPIIVWGFLKPYLFRADQFKSLQQQLKKFKYHSGLFNVALKNQTCYHVNDELLPIVMGNLEAKVVITMIANLFCIPCGMAHRSLTEWLGKRDDLQLKIVLASTDNEEHAVVVRHITSLSLLSDNDIVINALNSWYERSNKNYEDWAIHYPVNLHSEVSHIIEQRKIWCEMAEIAYTPTLLINGYKLPEPYTLEDLKYLFS